MQFRISAVLLLMALVAQAETVLWDGTHSDITNLSSNVSSPNDWTESDTVWNTTDETVDSPGTQADIRLAMGQVIQLRHAGQINSGFDAVYCGGGDTSITNDAVSPFSQLIAFDAGAFSAAGFPLRAMSVTLRKRISTDTQSFRWFIESDGQCYVSAVVDSDVGTDYGTYTLGDAEAGEWFAFDGNANIGTAIGASVGSLILTNLTYAGILTTEAYTNAANWHGAIVQRFAVSDETVVPAAMPYMGRWGPRMSLPSEKWPDQLTGFDVAAFSNQIAQLTDASHVMVNVTHPADPSYYTSPNPELEAAIGADELFPERDLLDEVLDMIQAQGKKAIVYFASEGLDRAGTPAVIRTNWNHYIESQGMDNTEATRELILRYYAEKFGPKIEGWWFDGSGHLDDIPGETDRWKEAVHAGNPEAIVSFNRMAGVPFECTAFCDYFGGHPTPRAILPFWDSVNLPMVEAIEAGPWMDAQGNPVNDPASGALGHIFMGLQDRWNFGTIEFPPLQAVDWATRVVDAGGMYTWAVPRDVSEMLNGQFLLLKQINAAMTGSTVVASGENTPNETAVRAFDGDINTKWLTFTNAGWIAYDYTSTEAYAVTQYSITSANDGDARDPRNWELQGSNDGGMSWDTLDVQSNQDFTARFQTKTYGIGNTTAYKVYRLYITANNGAPETQLAELTLVAGMSFYEAWSADFELSGSNAVFSANPDGDEQDNLNEYAMGGNPTNEFDWGHVPVFGTHDENGTNWFEYVYARRRDAVVRGLEYTVEATSNLLSEAWNTINVTETGAESIDSDFEAVTNRIPMEAEGFMRLIIEFIE